MVYLGKRNYKIADCILTNECKKHLGKIRSEVCDKFAQTYCDYINSNGIAASLLEICIDIENQIVDQLNKLSAETRDSIFKYMYGIIKYCSNNDNKDIDQSMLIYLNALHIISSNFNINYNIMIIPYIPS